MKAKRLPVWLAVVALAAAWLLIIRAFVAPELRTWSWWFGPKEDGTWQAVTLDGTQVPAGYRYRINVAGGQIQGGFGLCYNWGFINPAHQREGMTADAVECLISRQALHDSYWALASANPRMILMPGETLRLDAVGHSGQFRRAKANGEGQ